MRNVVVTMCLFLMISSGAQLGRSGIQHLGLSYFHLVLTVVGLCVYFGWCMNYIYVLCEVAIVSQLSLSHSCSLHGIVWRWPFLRRNHYAVMPLSRASTRGRYSRIMGVTCSLVCDSSNGTNSFCSSALFIANLCCLGDHVLELACQIYMVQSSFVAWYSL